MATDAFPANTLDAFAAASHQKALAATAAGKFGPEIARERGGTYDVEDLACGMVKLENGGTIFVEASWHSHVERERIYTQLVGTKGGAELDPLRIYTDVNGNSADIQLQHPNVSGHEMEVVHFVECIRENKTPIATGEQRQQRVIVVEVGIGMIREADVAAHRHAHQPAAEQIFERRPNNLLAIVEIFRPDKPDDSIDK